MNQQPARLFKPSLITTQNFFSEYVIGGGLTFYLWFGYLIFFVVFGLCLLFFSVGAWFMGWLSE